MDQKEVDLLALSKTIWKWKTKILLFVFIVTSLSIGISLLLPKWYKAKTIVLAPQSASSSFNPLSLLGELGIGSMMTGNETLFRYLAILKSRTLRELLINKFDLINHYKSNNIELALKKINKNLIVEVGDEYQVEITMLDKDQELVARMTNYVAECLDSINMELSISNARNHRIFMGERVNDILDSLDCSSKNLASFMKEKGILSLKDQVSVGVEQAAILQAQIIQKGVELDVAYQSMNVNNPRINILEYELLSLKEKYSDFVANNNIRTLIPNFSQVPELQLQLMKMQRQIEYYTRLIEYLGPMYEQQKFEEAKKIPTLQILDRAVTPELKFKPKRSRIVIIVFILSGLLAMGFAIYKENKR